MLSSFSTSSSSQSENKDYDEGEDSDRESSILPDSSDDVRSISSYTGSSSNSSSCYTLQDENMLGLCCNEYLSRMRGKYLENLVLTHKKWRECSLNYLKCKREELEMKRRRDKKEMRNNEKERYKRIAANWDIYLFLILFNNFFNLSFTTEWHKVHTKLPSYTLETKDTKLRRNRKIKEILHELHQIDLIPKPYVPNFSYPKYSTVDDDNVKPEEKYLKHKELPFKKLKQVSYW